MRLTVQCTVCRQCNTDQQQLIKTGRFLDCATDVTRCLPRCWRQTQMWQDKAKQTPHCDWATSEGNALVYTTLQAAGQPPHRHAAAEFSIYRHYLLIFAHDSYVLQCVHFLCKVCLSLCLQLGFIPVYVKWPCLPRMARQFAIAAIPHWCGTVRWQGWPILLMREFNLLLLLICAHY